MDEFESLVAAQVCPVKTYNNMITFENSDPTYSAESTYAVVSGHAYVTA